MDEQPEQPAAPRHRLRRITGYILGAALLIACIVVAVQQGDWAALGEAPPHIITALLGLVAANVVLSGLVFSFITRPFEPPGRRVGLVEMQALIAASTLLNYLPLRPGLIGRAAYLKRGHGITYRASGGVLVVVLVISAIAYAVGLATALWTAPTDGRSTLVRVFFTVAIPAAAAAAVAIVHRASQRRTIPGVVENAATAMLPRAGEMVLTALRLSLVFGVIGQAIEMREAVILATCGMFITLVGLTPNGLGLREWLYGAIAASGFFSGDVEGGLQLGLTAALVDRAAEAAVVVPAGLMSMVYLKRRARAVSCDSAGDTPPQ